MRVQEAHERDGLIVVVVQTLSLKARPPLGNAQHHTDSKVLFSNERVTLLKGWRVSGGHASSLRGELHSPSTTRRSRPAAVLLP